MPEGKLSAKLKQATKTADELAHERELRHSERKSLAQHIRELEAENGRLERELGILNKATSTPLEPPDWMRQPRSGVQHTGTLVQLLSDMHFDEIVRPSEIGGVNAYNRRIATQRLGSLARNTVDLARDHWSGVEYDGIVVAMLGDNFSGDIHEELTQTNEDTQLGSLVYWAEQLAGYLRFMLTEFGKVHVPVVVGNHGRRTRKPRHKFRARDNFDWFLGQMLAREFRDVPGITFDVAESSDTQFSCYSTTFAVTHGDQTQGGGGIGGIWPPIMRLDARKRQRQAAVGAPYDHLVMGHWHQLIFGNSFTINGSLKGYDEYAFDNNFGYEPPQQALLMVSPIHGITMRAPVFCMDRKMERWGRAS